MKVTRTPLTEQVLDGFADYISTQVLADSLQLADALADGVDVELDDSDVKVSVCKA